jgi:hypothetical protein
LRYYGSVEAEANAKCVPDRKVDFYREVDGPDEFIGRTRTDSFGNWSITIPSATFGEGTAYVKVLKSKLKNGTVCLKARSNDFMQI